MLIRRGDRGEEVKTVQRALNRFGFNLDDDGIFGGDTEAAVRQFQVRNGLDVDGIVGEDTLNALGLEPDTLEELTISEGDKIDETIVFSEDEVEIPRVVQEKISAYVKLVEKQHNKLLNSLINALANFETTMRSASAKEANPDILGVLVSTAFTQGEDEVVSKIPGLSRIKAYFDAVTNELERAGRASQSLMMGNWIKDQRAAIDEQLRKDTIQDNLNLLQADTESDYLDLDVQGRQQFFDILNHAVISLSGPIGPSIDEFEVSLYEQWINAHFREIDDDAPGCIEYRLEFDNNVFDFVSCTVKAPSGDNIATAFNRLLDRDQMIGVRRPIDFKVRKQICLRVDNFVGGKSWSCGWLDRNNQIIHEPIHDEAKRGLRENVWRISVNRFKS